MPFLTEMAQWVTYHKRPTENLALLFAKIIGKFQENFSKEIYLEIKKHLGLFMDIALTKFDPASRDQTLNYLRQVLLDSLTGDIIKVKIRKYYKI